MNNCLIAQSGGPTAVINSSVAGILEKSFQMKVFNKIYVGLNGIEGILQNSLLELKENIDIERLKYTPSSFFGSCRYKLKNLVNCKEEYINFFNILKKYEITTFFYIGGNDSMDTVEKLNSFSILNKYNIKILGIPKTIDNDLPIMDHSPGFGSAAKFIATITLENYLDASVYNKENVLIIETMGRDTGWLAASGSMAMINNNSVVDLIYLPEVPFDKVNFIYDVKTKLKEKNTVIILVSEGLKNNDGVFLNTMDYNSKDKFGHIQLGGVASYLKKLLLNSGVKKVRTIELSTLQRSSMHCSSKRDIDEAYMLGSYAVENLNSIDSGYLIGLKRISNNPYKTEVIHINSKLVANKIKYFPKEWINDKKNNVTKDAYDYLLPLIQGESKIEYENGIPKYYKIQY